MFTNMFTNTLRVVASPVHRTRIYPPSPQRGDFSFQKDMEMHTSCALNFTFAVVNVQKLGMNRIP